MIFALVLMMDLDQIFIFVERLRKEAIGEPMWIREKDAFEYTEQSAKVVAVLKLVRAAQGVTAVKLLCERGLFVDLGVLVRCVQDCHSEIYFLLEAFPKTSSNVDQFVKSFFEGTIHGYLSGETHPVQSKKIRNATLRILEAEQNHQMREDFESVYKTFSGYVHANYAHIMEMYNGETRLILIWLASLTFIRVQFERSMSNWQRSKFHIPLHSLLIKLD